MIWIYNGYKHALYEVGLQVSVSSPISEQGIAGPARWTFYGQGELLRGNLSQDEMFTEYNKLAAAYQVDNKPGGLYMPDKKTPACKGLYAFDPSNCFGNIYVVRRPALLNSEGAVLGTHVPYEFQIDFERYPTDRSQVIQWEESIQIVGTGAAKWHYQGNLEGNPTRIQSRERTTITVVQEGEGVGLLGYPQFPGPVLPNDEHQDIRKVRRSAPILYGNGEGAVKKNWPIRWEYNMESLFGTSQQPSSRLDI